MKVTDLPPKTLERIARLRWDRIIEKHEGPEDWGSTLEYYDPEFMLIDGRQVLLPIPREEHANVTVFRCTVGDAGESLTLFLKNTTRVPNPSEEKWFAGFVAVCDRLPGEEFYIAVLYHEWFIDTLRAGGGG